jgi:hypothetical protein
MKADLSLRERQRIGKEDQREVRAALVRSHFDTMDGWQLVAGGALHHNLRVAAIVHANLHGQRAGAPSPRDTPMLIMLPTEPGSVDQPDLRARLGLS